ncbi:MAG TPA: mechanosensitive ion channel domain-containing protein [Steroidobacteraceae bacterium]|nr:mechanosensitive ion channel domain-containing protein [Steroidobacteraceae bacterium]
MSPLKKLAASLLAVLLLATGYGVWVTQPSATPPVPRPKGKSVPVPANSALPVIDEDTFRTARRLARLATTAEEQPLAQSAVQIADHELDLAFAGALRHIEAHPPLLTPEAQQIQQRLKSSQQQLESDTQEVKRLGDALEKAPDAQKPAIQDRLDLVKSQVELEQDEVQEANDDLLQAGGNLHQRIQMMQQEHEASMRAAAAAPPSGASPLGSLHGLVGQVRRWLALRGKRHEIAAAERHAADSAAQLTAERQQIAVELTATKKSLPHLAARGQHPAGAATPSATPPPVAAPASTAAAPSLVNITRQLAAEQRRLTVRDERITARRRLADVYGQWDAVLAGQERTILHDCLNRAAIVLAALLALLVAESWVEKLLGRAPIDRRQIGTLQSVVGVAMQIVGVVLILLVLVGVPGQLGTMLGLAGAGLTVALKDFIVAFVGWFVLMGKNGIRVGDWVEINGVSGEVVQLGMLHTVLLETGNWTDAGHPTGRRVTFTNSFATAGHYFNFSTSGQWLWDELVVMVPYDRDPSAVAAAIQKEVIAATAESTKQAELEWRRAARGQSGAAFSAQPGIAVRPASGGVEIAVRYVTRASERYALRARLYQCAVGLLALQPGAQRAGA